jgi:ATP-dependent helicase HepA
MRAFRVGQRWTSDAEPELGLGTLVAVEERHVEIAFEASESRRRYATATAPLRRARFRVGDLVQTRTGSRSRVRGIEEEGGLVTYLADVGPIPEGELSPIASVDGPAERLDRGDLESSRAFELRQEAFRHLHRIRTSAVRGFAGARIDLVPHQLFIASTIARREAPRVLLADEVGLGKTIEACLVVHRMLLAGEADRALVLVPEHLVHQWFVELLRRFDLHFRIFDEERSAALERSDRGAEDGEESVPDAGDAGREPADDELPNPFLEEQLVLTDIAFLLGDRRRAAQAAAASWDVLVVDEAHHLTWRPGEPSPGYALVEALAERSASVLLLTGTPAQLGEEGHFARLHLLDPARHGDLERHRAEAAAYATVARRIEDLAASHASLPDDGSIVAEVADSVDRAEEDAVLDRYGPGRVMFRNTRSSIGGFPRRVLHPAPLEALRDEASGVAAVDEIDLRGRRERGELTGFAPAYDADPRVPWLAGLLRSLAPEKVLVIVQTPEQVAAIGEALSREVTVKRAVFHERLSLVQRDRNAAYFAEEDGARMLLCSEIGSEGRNFQFAHHLVLFDLPLDPELLEQRIGRLDRIGQSSDVSIHAPYVRGSGQEVLFRWYHEGLDAFARPVPDGSEIRSRLGDRVAELARGAGGAAPPPALVRAEEVDALVRASRALCAELSERVAAGRDRLLERSSFRPHQAAALVAEIARQDADPELEEFMHRVFDRFGVEAEDLGDRTYRLGVERVVIDVFPGLGADGATVTFSRAHALKREDVSFLTWDHPMVVGALDLLVSSHVGTVAFAAEEGGDRASLLLEASFVLESPAPRRLGLERFLPATPIRIVVDQDLRDRGDDGAAPSGTLRDAPRALVDDVGPVLRALAPAMLARAREMGEERGARVVARSVEDARRVLASEIERLASLAAENGEVRPDEIERLRARLAAIEEHVRGARLRLDALRAIWCGPADPRAALGRLAGGLRAGSR